MYLSREALFSATVIGGVLEKLRVIFKGTVLESFKASFFSAGGVPEGAAADGDSVEVVLVSGTSDPSSDADDPPPKRPFSLPVVKV
jgi:hypothetical protein